MSCELHFRWYGLRIDARMLALTLLLLVALSFLVPTARAQDEERVAAPGKLSVETTLDGLLLSWEAPASEPEKVTGYEIAGLHVQRGVGIVEELTVLTDEKTTSWKDETATDPDLRYVYRVRALRGGDQGQWSSFVITEIDEEVLQSLTETEAESPGEPTAQPDSPAIEPTASVPEAEATPVPLVTAVLPPEGTTPDAPPPGVTPGAPPAEPREEPARQEPAPVEPTAKSEAPPPEPTASRPEPEPTAVPPVAPVAPPPEEKQEPAPEQPAPEPPSEPTAKSEAPPPEPTASMPEPEPTASG